MTENPYDGLGGRCPDTDPNEHDAHTVWMDGELLDAALELVRRHGFDEGYIRPMAFVGADPDSNTVSLTSADRYPTRVAVLAWPRESHEDPDGLDVMVSSWRKHASDQIPTTAKATGPYVNSLLASKEARRSGRDDGIVLNTEGNVAEGATSNLFLVRDGELFTPGVAQSPLEGITRRTVLTLADELGYPAHPDATIGRGSSTPPTNSSSSGRQRKWRRSAGSTTWPSGGKVPSRRTSGPGSSRSSSAAPPTTPSGSPVSEPGTRAGPRRDGQSSFRSSTAGIPASPVS